ncbi:hypothetical protein [Marichromatium sp. AB31]|uniref:hypothetical protein n=1 Tax=Marichromatium sp. AB31 TaxID=2483362 RepID=UPI0011CE8966|nr:hypothetical protein [Marichromatium sp. AB31]
MKKIEYLSLVLLIPSVVLASGKIDVPYGGTGSYVLALLSIYILLFTSRLEIEKLCKVSEGLSGKVDDLSGKIESLGLVEYVGVANEAAMLVFEDIKGATKVRNTYLVQGEPYHNGVGCDVKNKIVSFLKDQKNVTWEETVSESGVSRVKDIVSDFDDNIPSNFKVKKVLSGGFDFPVCNFIIADHRSQSGRKSVVYFGWGYFRNDFNQGVFRSTSKELIDFFGGYNSALRAADISSDISLEDLRSAENSAD